MRDATITELRDVAGLDLYSRNAFRITGLPTTVDRRTARRRQQQLNTALQVGADIDTGIDTGIDGPSDPAEVRSAFDRVLGDPRRRLVEELFWLWDTPDSTCNCPRKLHRDHDEAVRAHSAVLDQEVAGQHPHPSALSSLEQGWAMAARHWKAALASPAFWSHVRHRISTLDDRQLPVSAAESLRAELPLALLEPLTVLAAAAPAPSRLAAHARNWPAPQREIDLRLEEAAGKQYDQFDSELRQAAELLRSDAPRVAADHVYNSVLPLLTRLEALVPHQRHRRTAEAQDRVSVVLNNCALHLIEAGSVLDGQAERWLVTAGELAIDARGRDTISQNRATLGEMREALARIQSQVNLLVRAGRVGAARTMLRRVRRSLAGQPGSDEIDRMLADLSPGSRTTKPARSPATRPPRAGRRRRARLVLRLIIIALMIFAIVHFWPFGGGKTAAMFSDKVSANAPAGTCIENRDSWQQNQNDVEVVDCAEKHWGEVLAYVPLTSVPGKYPGPDQTSALALFHCGEALAQQGLPATQYVAERAVASEQYWNDGDRDSDYENYATCVAHRIDDKPITGGQVSSPNRPHAPMAVTMSLHGQSIWGNAPVGTCVQTKQSLALSAAKVPIVRCEATHWAEVLGYPVLYAAGGKWPGDKVVYAAAAAKCKTVFNQRKAPRGYTYRVGWPGKAWWDDPKQVIYAYCLLHQVDDNTFKGKP